MPIEWPKDLEWIVGELLPTHDQPMTSFQPEVGPPITRRRGTGRHLLCATIQANEEVYLRLADMASASRLAGLDIKLSQPERVQRVYFTSDPQGNPTPHITQAITTILGPPEPNPLQISISLLPR